MKNFNKELVKDFYTLTPMQEGMLFHFLTDKSSKAYFEQFVFTIQGELIFDLFEKSFNELINRFDAFRTVFLYQGTVRPLQVVLKKRYSKVLSEDISGYDKNQKEAYISEYIEKDKEKGFDLTKDVLMRMSVLKTDYDLYTVIWSHHHIVMDGWCLGIIIDDFLKIYESLKGNKTLNLDRIYPYSRYIQWLEKQDKEKAALFWENYLKDYEQSAVLPKGNSDNAQAEYRQEKVSLNIDENIVRRLENVAKINAATLSTVFRAIWGLLLQRYNNVDDVVFGAVVSGRPAEIDEVEKIIGLFINTVPVRVKNEENQLFSGLLAQVQNLSLLSDKYCYLPLSDIQSNATAKNYLINNIMVFENYPMVQELDNLVGKYETGFNINNASIFEQTNYDFNISVVPGTKLTVNFIYNANTYKKEFVERVKGHFDKVIGLICQTPDILVNEIDILTDGEKDEIINQFNNTQTSYPKDKTIHELFEEQAGKTPDNIALIFEDRHMTYRELNRRASALAKILRQKGAVQDGIIALMVERSIEMIIGILGILKAGAAYLPIDPAYPQERKLYMLEDSRAAILLTSGDTEAVEGSHGEVFRLDDEGLYERECDNLISINRPGDLAYIIYTSGTTGKPKGTMIEHRNVVRLLFNDKMQFDFSDRDVWTMFHSYCFDFSVWEMYGALLYGGRLVIVPGMTAKDPNEYLMLLKQEGVTVLNQTPTAFYGLADEEVRHKDRELAIRYVIFGGEALKPSMLKEWKKKYPETKLINMYGITETTVHVTYKEITEADIERGISSIGRPLPTLTAYIMDKNMKLLPVGAAGELCVGGDGVSRGYLNRPELTAEKFVENPYKPGEMLYRSGDLARLLPDRNMEYLGRMDQQVKIRGHRIEPSEIENRMESLEGVWEAVAITREDKEGDKYICLYYVSEKALGVNELREHLMRELPDYMIPAHFVRLEKIPLTSNGKVDKKALPVPEEEISMADGYISPQGETENKLANIWKDILNMGKVSANNNFLAIGGHSLKSTLLASRILKEFNVEVTLKEIFKNPVLRDMARFINGKKSKKFIEISPAEICDYYPVSSAQKRIFMLNKSESTGTSYNMSGITEICGRLDIERFKGVIKSLVKRHEALRTSFHVVEGDVLQSIHENVDFNIYYEEINNEPAIIMDEFVKPFDLGKAPLFRAGLLKVNEYKHFLLFDMHHIVSDGMSMNILMKEIATLYSGGTLAELKIQYKDFTVWQNIHLRSDAIIEQERFWIDTFKGEIPILNLPTDYQRPARMSYVGDIFSFTIDKNTVQLIKQFSQKSEVTLFAVLLAAYNVLLSRITGQEDIIVGVPVAGRRHADLESVVGMFVNTIALRNYPVQHKCFMEFLDEVGRRALDAFDNQDYQFEMLLEKLAVKRDLSRNPLFDIVFNMLNINEMNTSFTISGLEFIPYGYNEKTAKFDITTYIEETGEGIKVDCRYRTDLFHKLTIEYIMGEYARLLDEIAYDPYKKIKDYDIFKLKWPGSGTNKAYLGSIHEKSGESGLDGLLIKSFEEKVQKFSDSPAVKCEAKTLTYSALNNCANHLANAIYESFNEKTPCNNFSDTELCNDNIALLFEHGVDMIIGIMGTLKACKVFVPLDPSFPADRLVYIMKDTKSCTIVTNSANIFKAQILKSELGVNIKIININLLNTVTPLGNLDVDAGPEQICYIMYTSGSAGAPKGVTQNNRNIMKFIMDYSNNLQIISSDKIALTTTYTHTVAIIDIFSSLLNGATLLPYDIKSKGGIDKLGMWLDNEKVTIFHTVPTIYRYFIKTLNDSVFQHIRLVILGGEAVIKDDIELYKKHFSDNCLFVNLFGSSEVLIVTSHKLNKNTTMTRNSIPIGYPVDGVDVLIIKENSEEAGVYEIGEMVYRSPYLSPGYWNLPEMNAKAFMADSLEPEIRIYKSGDIGRFLPNNGIEYLGRGDFQVKIRGNRIELGEIEAVLDKMGKIEKSVVVAVKNANYEDYLVAYYTTKDSSSNDAFTIRTLAHGKLPDFMVPAYFIHIDDIPLTPNGKIDRNKLIYSFDEFYKEKGHERPLNEVERKLAEIFQEILMVDKVGANDSFFELGGHSLTATSLIEKVYKLFGIELSIGDVFEKQTISNLSILLEERTHQVENMVKIIDDIEKNIL